MYNNNKCSVQNRTIREAARGFESVFCNFRQRHSRNSSDSRSWAKRCVSDEISKASDLDMGDWAEIRCILEQLPNDWLDVGLGLNADELLRGGRTSDAVRWVCGIPVQGPNLSCCYVIDTQPDYRPPNFHHVHHGLHGNSCEMARKDCPGLLDSWSFYTCEFHATHEWQPFLDIPVSWYTWSWRNFQQVLTWDMPIKV